MNIDVKPCLASTIVSAFTFHFLTLEALMIESRGKAIVY